VPLRPLTKARRPRESFALTPLAASLRRLKSNLNQFIQNLRTNNIKEKIKTKQFLLLFLLRFVSWTEQDPMVLLSTVRDCLSECEAQLRVNQFTLHAIGVTNQRETTVVWDRATGKPLHNVTFFFFVNKHQIFN
jgi:glycerol kinase